MVAISNVLPYVNVDTLEARRLGYEAWGDAFGTLNLFGLRITALVYMNVVLWGIYNYIARIKRDHGGGSFSRLAKWLDGTLFVTVYWVCGVWHI